MHFYLVATTGIGFKTCTNLHFMANKAGGMEEGGSGVDKCKIDWEIVTEGKYIVNEWEWESERERRDGREIEKEG